MSAFEPPDCHHFSASLGWLELGCAQDAEAEWQRLSLTARARPEALELRWQILAAEEDWARALSVAEELVARAPDCAAGWLHRAYALRRAPGGGLAQAWDALHPAADLFPQEDVIAYNLACYATQLGQLDDGWEWLLRALQLSADPPRLRAMAGVDTDLAPLRERIKQL